MGAQITLPHDLIYKKGLRFGMNIQTALTGAHVAVKHGTLDGDIIGTAAITDVCIGVVSEDTDTAPIAADKVTVYGAGNIVFCVADGAITKGAQLQPSVTIVGSIETAIATGFVVGIAMSGAADTELVAVMVTLAGIF